MKIIYQAMEYPKLLLIGIVNLFYNAGLFTVELLLFGTRCWWWKLNSYYFIQYFSQGLNGINRLVARESAGFNYSPENFTYGETPCITVKHILAVSGCEKGKHFVDLGCGRGKATFYAHYLHDMKAEGCEIIPTFIKKAEIIKGKMNADGVNFINRDILEVDFSEADIVYIAGTTFDDELVEKLNEKLEKMKKNSVVVTLSYPLQTEMFDMFAKKSLFFSWGKNSVYFHRRN
jgi:SAM-dependent methyltransferase